MQTQHTATYGDFRSPTRANFQNVPKALCTYKKKAISSTLIFGLIAARLMDIAYPVLFRSISDGKNERRYVHVQISKRITDNKL